MLSQLIVALFLWIIFLFFSNHFQAYKESSEAPDSGSGKGPLAGVRVPKKRGPQSRAGAVALAEPDDDDETQFLPPRTV
jgi:hypothetical protein